ncbi:putative alpha-amylase [Flagelloscypha sp. PMI_526]|nr:putative alpha-amylase [Flagelloscypha sp. PMI_526]
MSHHANEEYGRKDEGHNYTMIQAFEWYCTHKGGGNHWNYVSDKLDRLDAMGVTAMWLPPPTKAANPHSTGYDIYDHWDLGEFDQKGAVGTNYGTKEQYIALIKKAKEKGIVSYIDAVLNHKFGADRAETFAVTEVDTSDRNKEVSDLYDIEGWTGFDFAGRGDKYSKMKYSFNHFTGVDYDNKTQKNGIFKIHGDGKSWADGVDNENSNYDYLMGADLDHKHPEVREDVIEWGKWIIKETGAAGFRFDAVKHIDRDFIGDFVKTVRATTPGHAKLFAVGEFWKDSYESLEKYVTALGTQFSVFDAPLHYNFKEAGDKGAEYDLRQIWDGTVVQNRPIDAVTLVDNHDTQVDQALESWVAPWFKPLAYALILLRQSGYPCVFWGDIFGCRGENPQDPVAQLEDIIRCRKLFAYGELRDYFDHANCVGWVRTGQKDRVGRKDGYFKHMEIGKGHAGEVWTDILGWKQGEVTIGEDGWADFGCPDATKRQEFGT